MRHLILCAAIWGSTAVSSAAAKSIPYVEQQQQQNTRVINFSQAPTGVTRVIHNVSCIVQLANSIGVQTPALEIGTPGVSDFQVIYIPMQAASQLVSINTSTILAYARPGDAVLFEAGYPGNVPINLACTLTGNDNS